MSKKKTMEPEFKLAFLRPGVYRHYAGKLYYVLTTARHTETGEELVIYFPMYAHKNGGHVPQARPLSIWLELVKVPYATHGINSSGKRIRIGRKKSAYIPRFRFVGDTLPPNTKEKE